MALLVGSDAIRAWRYHIGGNRPLRFSSGLGTGNGRITVALDPFGWTVSTSRLQNEILLWSHKCDYKFVLDVLDLFDHRFTNKNR